MLQFIIGASGSGKTRMAYEKIIQESIDHPEKQFFVIIPEQASLEAQKNLVRLHPRKGIMNIDALSFMRLSHRVFAENGVKEKVRLDDAGKTLVVKRVLKEKASELRYFAHSAGKRGFCIEMKSAISELLQYGVDEEKLERMIELSRERNGENGILTKKLADIAVCYEGFKDYISDRFIAPEEIYDLLAENVGSSKSLNGATIVLDGYTGFTPSQYRLLSELFKYCEKVYITITMDPADYGIPLGKHELFYLSSRTMEVLRKIAADAGCEEEPVIFAAEDGNCPRFRDNPAMADFEKRLFPNGRVGKQRKTETADCPVELYAARSPAEEVKALSTEIKKALRRGLRYRDMAVITGAMETYAPLMAREFEEAGIPGFLDFRRGILGDPYVELIRSIAELPLSGYSHEGMMRLLKNPLFGVPSARCDRLDNYLTATGIRGKSGWKKEWKKTFRRPYTPDLAELNEDRSFVFDRIEGVTAVLEGNSTVSARTEALKAFLENISAVDKLDRLCAEISRTDEYKGRELTGKNLELQSEYDQIPGFVNEIFERMQNLIGDEILPLKDFCELLELGFTEASVGLLPRGMDCMLVGDVERSRIGNIRKLFFIGVNDGIIPAAAARGGIISDADRAFFEEFDIELSPTMREKAYTGEFYLYQNLTKPSESIYVSYSEKDSNDSKLNPSYLVAQFKRMYPGLECLRDRRLEVCGILASDGGNRALRETLRDLLVAEGGEERLLRERAAVLLRALDIPKAEFDDILSAVFYESKEQKISAELAKRIYRDSYSITRLEAFAGCFFKHFLQYGARLSERKEYEVKASDTGTICHDSLELCVKKLKAEGLSLRDLSVQQCREYAKASVNEVIRDYENGMMLESGHFRHLADRYRDVVERSLRSFAYQLSESDFEPEWLEKPFEISIGDLTLNGRFDRVDICVEDGRCYTKIVDYKSGKHRISEEEIEAGLQLQLGVYLGAAEKLMEEEHPELEFVPAAVLYYHMNDPIVDDTDDPEQKILKTLKPLGRAADDPKSIIMLDHGFEPDENEKTQLHAGYGSDRIPVGTTKSAEFDRFSTVWSRDEFRERTEHLFKKIGEFAKEIRDGEALANPVKINNRTGCDFCDYKDICSFGALNGKKIRVIGKETDDGTEGGEN